MANRDKREKSEKFRLYCELIRLRQTLGQGMIEIYFTVQYVTFDFSVLGW